MGAWPNQEPRDTARPAAHAPYDARFRRLIGRDAWAELPRAVQRRFSKRLSGGAVALYRGHVVETRFSTLGWLLAQALRLIGAPLPIGRDQGVPAVVSVSEDGVAGGQVWSRLYARRTGFPQVIHSAKRFAGPTGLEEYIGFGRILMSRCWPRSRWCAGGAMAIGRWRAQRFARESSRSRTSTRISMK